MPCVVIRCPPLRQTFFRLTVSGGPAFTQGFAERRIPTLNLPSSHCLGPRLDSLSSSRFDVGQILDDRLGLVLSEASGGNKEEDALSALDGSPENVTLPGSCGDRKSTRLNSSH